MSRKDVTPPPRRITQELFVLDDNGEIIPAVKPPEVTKAAEVDAAQVPVPSANGGSQGGNPPDGTTPPSSADDFGNIGGTNGNGTDDTIPPPAEFNPAASGPLARVMDGNFLLFAS